MEERNLTRRGRFRSSSIGDPEKCGRRQGDPTIAGLVAKCASDPQSPWRTKRQKRSTEFGRRGRSRSRTDAQRCSLKASAWVLNVRGSSMSAIEVATPCFYRLRGSMKLRISSVEMHAPLECKSTAGSETTEECTVWKRSYHPKCDHLMRKKYLSSISSCDFVEPLDDDSQSESLPHGCNGAFLLTPNVGKQICFPCGYHKQIE